MKEKILFVDDEPRVLKAIQRNLRKKFDVEIAIGAHEALQCIASKGPFAVIVSDLSMPDMDGIEFFERLRRSQPLSVRIMFTGNADVQSAMEAVNKGHVFRFLIKPASSDIVMETVKAGLEQYRLITAEKELLRGTLGGIIKMITQLLGLVNPEAFGRASRIKKNVVATAKILGADHLWRFELAAMLSQIGCVMLPQDTLGMSYRGDVVSSEEQRLFAMHPVLARELVVNIPRLQEVAEMVAYQNTSFSGERMSEKNVTGQAIPLGARILKIALDYDSLILSGSSEENALVQLMEHKEHYDPEVLEAFASILASTPNPKIQKRPVKDILPGAILAQDVRGRNGMLYFAKGMELSQPYLEHLHHLVRSGHTDDVAKVEVPSSERTVWGDASSRSVKDTPVLDVPAVAIGTARKIMQMFKTMLDHDMLGPAIDAICSALEVYMAKDIVPQDKKELFRLIRSGVLLLGENERFASLYPDTLVFKQGREYELLAHLKMFAKDLTIIESENT
ncbi:HD domain-containing phosphohydrolase [Desulfovibrio inopinatus]|uniref:HD domain-containing phosphohydrolase n=1 Tax=Desulfovibrio inopinatus TaxID=102109 RepID=UPI00040B7419|nr:HD domain-containing phosphohydrolase [Desulfovibrio inopinatus]